MDAHVARHLSAEPGPDGRMTRTRPVVRSALVVLLAFGALAPTPVRTSAQVHVGPPIVIDPASIEVTGALGTFTSTVEHREVAPGVTDVTVRIAAAAAVRPPEFTVRFDHPSVDVAGFWNTNLSNDRVNYYGNRVTSRATSGAPVITLYNSADVNRITVAASDALNPVELRAYLREEDERFYWTLTFLSERHPATRAYEVTIRIDTRSVPFHRALAGVSAWWASLPGYTPAPVPAAAKTPMYSTWYGFHQNVDPDSVLAELRIAAELGYEAVIVDDGWQTLDNRRGYRFTGDWKPERIGDMKRFVDAVHDLGMRFLLWYSVPLVGERSRSYERFRGRYLRYWKSQGAYVLDPRYPEVREFLIRTYERAVDDWGVDGFKLDFMGFFAATDSTVLERGDGRDYASVNEATDRLMSDVMGRLRARNPDVLVEFRQPYTGPLMRKYGNMFRGVDAPNNAAANRAEVTDVRLLAGNTAPHSDMFIWHPDDTVESAALQFLNVLFAVPQLSVRLTHIPREQLEMVRFWTHYWKENRRVLMEGDFTPVGPAAVYPVIRTYADGATVAAVYEDMVVALPPHPYDRIDLVNAKSTERLALELPADLGAVAVVAYDTRGRVVRRERMDLGAGLHGFRAPPSGLVRIRRLGDSSPAPRPARPSGGRGSRAVFPRR